MAEPTITAVLHGGPLKGKRMEVASLAGRPPITLDLPSGDGGAESRYCLDSLVQGGDSAVYSFLYRI